MHEILLLLDISYEHHKDNLIDIYWKMKNNSIYLLAREKLVQINRELLKTYTIQKPKQ